MSTMAIDRSGMLVPIAVLLGLVTSAAAAVEFRDVGYLAVIDYVQHQIPPSELGMAELISWRAAAGDFDADGWTDLYVTRLDARDLLYRNRGDGTFDEVSDLAFGAARPARRSNGATWGDIEIDGDTMFWEMDAGSHFLGQSEPVAHFGLGTRSAPVDLVEILWPGGQVTRYRDVPINRRLTAVERVPEPASAVLALAALAMGMIRRARPCRDAALGPGAPPGPSNTLQSTFSTQLSVSR
jgi:hypothetical protein